MSDNLDNLIVAVAEKQPLNFQNYFEAEMAKRVETLLATKREELAKSLYNPKKKD